MDDFYTLSGYRKMESGKLTTAMEDYLEMIFRLSGDGGVRVGELSEHLHVKPSSASKMISHLAEKGLVDAEKYGRVRLSEKGRVAGAYLIRRHETVHRFLCALNGTSNELEEAEKIEHFLSRRTVENLEILCDKMKKDGAT